MEPRPLSSNDVQLFRLAKAQLERSHHPERHQVAAALRTSTGSEHVGLHLGSRRINVCAEASAIANARMADGEDIATIVAVCKDDLGRIVVTNPCGVCRELMGQYGPRADVIVDVGGKVRKVRAADLMPNPWMFPRENDWSVEDPQLQEPQ